MDTFDIDYMSKILELSDFAGDMHANVDDISRFLVVRTLSELDPIVFYVGWIHDGFELVELTGFGYSRELEKQTANIPLRAKHPLTQAVTHNKLVLIRNTKADLNDFPDLKANDPKIKGWKTCLAWPINSHGGAIAFFASEFDLGPASRNFIMTVGSISGLAFKIAQDCDCTTCPKTTLKSVISNTVPTARQELIVKRLRSGLSNKAIADELGYSESLIRQETIAIYKIFNVAGRKELMAVPDEEV
jgi:DNA-binding CsgD family transcriptional regulator